MADRVRLRESARGTASIVTAPCYLFRRDLLDELPPDTIADDIHVACCAMASGRRVAIAAADVRELRSPRSVTALFRHKLRKGDAYLREIFRFLPLLRRFRPDARMVFGIRALLHLVVPPIAFATAAWAAFRLATLPAPVLAVAMLTLAAALVTSRMARTAAALCCLVLMLVVVTTVALAAYPFSTQTASWRKIAQASKYRLSGDVE